VCELYLKQSFLSHSLPSYRFHPGHLIECEFVPISCPHEGCCDVPIKRDYESHLSSCSYRLVSCPNQCGVTLLSRDLITHCSTTCTNKLYICPHQESSFECTATCLGQYRDVDLINHMNSPEYLLVEIQHLVGRPDHLLLHSFIGLTVWFRERVISKRYVVMKIPFVNRMKRSQGFERKSEISPLLLFRDFILDNM
jgi:hypothetical protein